MRRKPETAESDSDEVSASSWSEQRLTHIRIKKSYKRAHTRGFFERNQTSNTLKENRNGGQNLET